MRALDLFCGAGGASMGLHLAGFEVVGVDIKPQKNYPFTFVQADAMKLPLRLSDFDYIWASPPCQEYSVTKKLRKAISKNEYPEMIEPVRTMLKSSGKHYTIENVRGAPLHNAIMLCGTMFGLRVLRHRLFESSFLVLAPGHPPHRGGTNSSRGYSTYANGAKYICVAGQNYIRTEGAAAMGIDWMTNRNELSESIPPAYSKFIAEACINQLKPSSDAPRHPKYENISLPA
jgi:DNA (cytosine-5)-methyltransferase 1